MKTVSVNLEIPIYKVVLNILVADSVPKALKWLGADKECDKEFLDGANGIFYISDKGHWIVAFNYKKLCHGTISHESFHAVSAIMRKKGVVYGEKSEEAFAYLLDYLVTEIYKIIKNSRISIS